MKLKLVPSIPRFLILLVFFMQVFNVSCNQKKKDSNSQSTTSSITISASLSTGLNGSSILRMVDHFSNSMIGNSSLLTSPILLTAPKVDSIYAIPLYEGKLQAWSMEYGVSGQVDADGKMTISLAKSMDYVILLLDTTQTRKIDQVVAYLNLSDSGAGLMRIPTKNAKTDNLDVGTVTKTTNSTTAASSTELNSLSADFEADLSVLQEIAKTDDILQMAKNLYANYVSTTENANTGPYFLFNGVQTALASGYSDPSSLPYSGYGLYFSLAHPGVKLSEMCAASGAKNLRLTPPSSVVSAPEYGSVTQGTFSYMDNEAVEGLNTESSTRYSCGAPFTAGLGARAIYIHGQSANEENFGFNWGSGSGFAGSIASGQWVLGVDSTEVARFDLKAASVVDSQNHPTVFIPSISVGTTSGGDISTINVKFYSWNSTNSAFEVITDPTAFLSSATDYGISFADQTQSPIPNILSNLVHQGSGVFTVSDLGNLPWKFSPSHNGSGTPTHPVATVIGVSYSLYGATISFNFQQQ